MYNLAIYGAGGFGREMVLMIRQINESKPTWKLLGFYDDGFKKGQLVDGLEILGGMRELNAVKNSLNLVIAIADPAVRKKIRMSITNSLVAFPVLIHPSVNVGDARANTIGEGTIITAGSILTTNIHIQPFVMISMMCTVGHDVSIGAFTTVLPACSLSGFVQIGKEALIGSGARILPKVSIGNCSKIGAGAVVTKEVKEGDTVVGVPAKSIAPDDESYTG